MTILEQIAYFQNRRDEVPNQELAKKLADSKDSAGIQEIASHLGDKNSNIQSDCLKVLYEVGYLDPSLISKYAEDFLRLLQHKNNRMVWGGMIALSTISALNPEPCFQRLGELLKVIDEGSVITQDAGVKTLAGIASAGEKYSVIIFPYILDHLQNCGSKYLANRAEISALAITPAYQSEFIAILENRLPELNDPMAKRIKKLIKIYR